MKVHRQFDQSLGQHEIKHIALGFFDGLHLGHRSVIINEYSSNALDQTCVLTFWPHPATVLRQSNQIFLLTELDEKFELLQSWGVGHSCVIPFTQDFANQDHKAFHQAILSYFPALESISVGPNFRYGKKRTGTPVTLSKFCDNHDIAFRLSDFVLFNDDPISSTRIRNLLSNGRIAEANQLLGRPFHISGEVVRGNQLGRTIGFPTANLKISKRINIPFGVYKTTAHLKDHSPVDGLMNFGKRPSLETSTTTTNIEVHLVGWKGDIYGQDMKCELLNFVRPERKFTDFTELGKQIALDLKTCYPNLSPVTGQSTD